MSFSRSDPLDTCYSDLVSHRSSVAKMCMKLLEVFSREVNMLQLQAVSGHPGISVDAKWQGGVHPNTLETCGPLSQMVQD